MKARACRPETNHISWIGMAWDETSLRSRIPGRRGKASRFFVFARGPPLSTGEIHLEPGPETKSSGPWSSRKPRAWRGHYAPYVPRVGIAMACPIETQVGKRAGGRKGESARPSEFRKLCRQVRVLRLTGRAAQERFQKRLGAFFRGPP